MRPQAENFHVFGLPTQENDPETSILPGNMRKIAGTKTVVFLRVPPQRNWGEKIFLPLYFEGPKKKVTSGF